MLAATNPINRVIQPSEFSPDLNNTRNSTSPARVMAGKPNRKEKRAAVSRSMPQNNPAGPHRIGDDEFERIGVAGIGKRQCHAAPNIAATLLELKI
jgi:hypothetical protein